MKLMSAETLKLSEVSVWQKDLNEIALVEDLEAKGIHAHSLLKADSEMPDAPLLEKIDRTMHEEIETQPEPTFAQRNRIITRRQNRRTTQNLMRRQR